MQKISFVTLVFATFIVAQTWAEFKSDLFICNNGTLAPGAALGARLQACQDPNLYKDKDPRCVGICISEAFGANKDGEPNRAVVSQIIKTQFPLAEQVSAEERIQKCFDALGTYDKNDTTCTAIAQYSLCGTQVVLQTKC